MRTPFNAGERLSQLQSEVTKTVERLVRAGASAIPFELLEFNPAIELWEELERYVLLVELPGIPVATLEVTAGPSSITISGEKRRTEEPTAETGESTFPRLVQTERRYGAFSRTIPLPGGIRTDSVSARMVDGVLMIEMTKQSGPKPVEIRVDVKADSPTSGGFAGPTTPGETNMPGGPAAPMP